MKALQLSSVGSLRKNGLVIFGARLASIITGMVFLLMVTGWLNPVRFGLWEIITDYVTFASYPAGLLSFWATRDIARGKPVGRTLLLCNLGLSMFGFGIYSVFTVVYGGFGTTVGPLLLAALLVPLAYLNQAAAGIAIGHRPAVMGYSLLVSEAAKLIVAYPALYIYHMEITGVILALIVSYVVQNVAITAAVWDAVSPRADFADARRWVGDSWIPLLYLVPSQLGIADTFVASIATGSTLLTGYYQAAFSLAFLISYAGLLASALYPLLIRGGSLRAPSITLDLILMFAIPMTVGVVVLAPTLLALLKPVYVSVAPSLTILAVWGFLLALSTFTDSTLLGLETADLTGQRSLRGYLKSSFFYVSGINVGYLAIHLVSVFAVVSFGTAANFPVEQVVLLWSLLQVGILAPAVLLKMSKVRSKASLELPRSLPAYLLSSLVMAGALLSLKGLVPSEGVDRLLFGGWVMVIVGIGAAAYFGVLFVMDRGFRRLALSVLGPMPSRGPAAVPTEA